jgi:hypothetical protein
MSVSIKVAIRCRPFTIDDELGVNMQQTDSSQETPQGEIELLKSTYSTNNFGFTWAWWSAYGYQRHVKNDEAGQAAAMKLINQGDVYAACGQKIKAELMDGNAVVLFAYGLSGSGKTFTVFGPDAVDIPEAWFKHATPHEMWGVFPHLAYEVFEEKAKHDGWKITMKYFQNIVDTVRDLMSDSGKEQSYKTGMKKDADGFMDIVWCSSKVLNSWDDLREAFQKANARKAISPTQFNHQSTRGHCIMTLEVEKPHPEREGMKQRGRLYVCDLAGTEPAGDIFYAQYKKKKYEDGTIEHELVGPHPDASKSKELQDQGKKINLSLSEMAQFFMKMAEAIKKKKLKPGQTLPGCNSYFLCKYLKDTMLQARTYLFCAIRPEVKYHPYTFSTLGFAKNASVIKLEPKKATSGMTAAERKLFEELEKMKALVAELQKGGGDMSGVQAQLAAKQAELAANLSGGDGGAAAAASAALVEQEAKELAERGTYLVSRDGATEHPYLINLDEDPFRSKRYLFMLDKPNTVFGPRDDVQLGSLMLMPNHCSIANEGPVAHLDGAKTVEVKITANEGDVFHNGAKLAPGVPATLAPYDRVVIANELLMYMHQADSPEGVEEPTAETAANEFRKALQAAQSGGGGGGEDAAARAAFEKEKAEFEAMKAQGGGVSASRWNAAGQNAADSITNEQKMKAVDQEILDVLHRIADVDKMMALLNRPHLEFKTSLQRSDDSGVPKVKVKVLNTQTDESILLDTFEFIKAHSILKDECNSLKAAFRNDRDYASPGAHEPGALFFDNSFQLGTAAVFLMDLSYMLETDEEETQRDIKNAVAPFNNIGKLEVAWVPLAGVEDDGDGDVPEAEGEELIGQPWTYRVRIRGAVGLPIPAALAYCQYEFFGEEFTSETVEQSTTNPVFDYTAVHHVECVTQQFLDYLQNATMDVHIFVAPVLHAPDDVVSTANATIRTNFIDGPPARGAAMAAAGGGGGGAAGGGAGAATSADVAALQQRSKVANKFRLAQANASVWTHIAAAMEAQKLSTDVAVGGAEDVLADEQLRGVVMDMVKLSNPEISIACADGKTIHIEWPPG